MGLRPSLPVNPWLLGAMGKVLCCIASWWSLVSCGEIAAEEDCESERGDRERNRGNGKTQEEGRAEQTHHSQYRQQYKGTEQKQTHITQFCCVNFSYAFIKLYIDYHLVSVCFSVYVGYPIGIPPKCRLHLLVMLSCSLQVRAKSQCTRQSAQNIHIKIPLLAITNVARGGSFFKALVAFCAT